MALKEIKKLPPPFGDVVRSKDLPSPYFLLATEATQKVADHAAERMQLDYRMNNKFLAELRAGRGFSPDVANWSFAQLTGINLSQPKRSANSPTLQPLVFDAATTSSSGADRIGTTQPKQDSTLDRISLLLIMQTAQDQLEHLH